MEDRVLKDNLGHIAVWVVFRDVDLEPEEDCELLAACGGCST